MVAQKPPGGRRDGGPQMVQVAVLLAGEAVAHDRVIVQLTRHDAEALEQHGRLMAVQYAAPAKGVDVARAPTRDVLIELVG